MVERIMDIAAGERIARIGVMVQLEVARRLVAQPRDPDYGALSVTTAARAESRILGRLS